MSAEELSTSLYNNKFKAALLDSYVAAQSPDYFPSSKSRVNKIIKSAKAFGFVPGQTMTSNDALIKCFRNYVEQNKQLISEDVEKATKTLAVRKLGLRFQVFHLLLMFQHSFAVAVVYFILSRLFHI